MATELHDIAPGLWIWRTEHPDWDPSADWKPPVTSTCVHSGNEVAVLDPIAPAYDAAALWARLEAAPPTMAVVLSPITSATSISSAPATAPAPSGPGSTGATTCPIPSSRPSSRAASCREGCGRSTTGAGGWRRRSGFPISVRSCFADALTAPEGELRVWASPAHDDRALPALRALLELPFELVIVSHGDPVHDRDAYERALELAPYSG